VAGRQTLLLSLHVFFDPDLEHRRDVFALSAKSERIVRNGRFDLEVKVTIKTSLH